MNLIFQSLLTAAVAAVAGLLFLRLRVPGGLLVGALVGVVLLNLASGQAYMYPQLRVVAQSITGAYIGCLVSKEDLLHLPRIIKPYLAAMSLFFLLNMAVAFFMWKTTDMSLITALFASSPGGMSDIPLIAMDVGGDVSVIVVMQFVRMVFGIAVLPSVILVGDKAISHAAPIEPVPDDAPSEIAARPSAAVSGAKLRPFLPVLLVAVLGGTAGKLSGLPAGTISASLIAVIVFKFVRKTEPMPLWLRRTAQIVAGCCVGASFDSDQLFALRRLVIPALVLVAGYSILCLLGGSLLARLFHMNRREAMLCLSPAGATEMALIAADLGVHSPNLIVMQICRLLGVITIFPHIYILIANLIG